MKNWKTTLAGIIVAAVAFATYQGYITTDVGNAIIGAATAFGLRFAQDANKKNNENATNSEDLMPPIEGGNAIPYPKGGTTKRP